MAVKDIHQIGGDLIMFEKKIVTTFHFGSFIYCRVITSL
jgi:hypothetical protein